MKDENLWNEAGTKGLIEFLTNADGEDHDAAVYDTKFEFDKTRPEAVRYIACCAMRKAEPLVFPDKGMLELDRFEYPKPTDGSVVPIDMVTENPRIREAYTARKKREAAALEAEPPDYGVEGAKVYVPDSSQYATAVVHAVQWRKSYREIPEMYMTPDEKIEYQKDLDKQRRAERRESFRYLWLPLICFFVCFLISWLVCEDDSPSQLIFVLLGLGSFVWCVISVRRHIV